LLEKLKKNRAVAPMEVKYNAQPVFENRWGDFLSWG